MLVAVLPSGEQRALMLAFDGDDEKARMLATTRQVMRVWGVVAYGLMIEAWTTTHAKGEVPRVKPRDSERRREVVMVAVCDAGGARRVSAPEIHRDEKRSWLGDPKDMEGSSLGPFVELLVEVASDRS